MTAVSAQKNSQRHEMPQVTLCPWQQGAFGNRAPLATTILAFNIARPKFVTPHA